MGNKPQAHAGFRLLVLRYACALRTLSESDVRRCSIPHDRCRSCVEERPGPGPVICPGTIRGGRCETQSQLAGCASRKLRLYVAYSTSTWGCRDLSIVRSAGATSARGNFGGREMVSVDHRSGLF